MRGSGGICGAATLRWSLVLSSVLVFLPSPGFPAGTTDTLVTTRNGFLVGEIKELDRRKLVFDTDATGKINVKWSHVIYLRSPRFFRVELSSGMLYFGSLGTDTTSTELIIALEQFVNKAPLKDVVAITRIKTGFWDRLDLSGQWGAEFPERRRGWADEPCNKRYTQTRL